MKSLFLATATVALLAVAPTFAQTMNSNPGGGTAGRSAPGGATAAKGDTQFIDHVARDGRAEVDLAELAQQKAQSAEVKALARRLADDHTKSNQQLMQIAQKDAVEPPTSAGKEASKERAKLEKLDGQAFDQAFVEAVVKDHKKDIQYFQKEQSSLHDPQLKSFAQQTLPVLQQHLQMAEQAQGASGSSSRPGASTGTSAGRTTR